MGIKPTSVIWGPFIRTALLGASLLFAGVMLTSCSILSNQNDQNEVSVSATTNEETPQMTASTKKIAEDTQQPDQIINLLETMQNSLEEQKHSIEDLQQRIKALENPKKTVNLPDGQQISTLKKEDTPAYTEPTLLYKKARSMLLEENFPGAGELFKAFMVHYPDSPLADNALYWLGECHYALGDFPDAIKVFKELVDRYPKGGKVPDALLKTAYSYLNLDDSDRAHHYLKLVVKGYPFTPAGAKAEQKLKTFQ